MRYTTASPFTYTFLDDRFNKTYQAEQNIGLILGIFAGLTIFVACLGLFALATFSAEQRTKEIGIRKVLGAEVSGYCFTLIKGFLKAGGDCIYDCCTNSVVSYEQMAAGLCLSYTNKLVDVFDSCYCSIGDSLVYSRI